MRNLLLTVFLVAAWSAKADGPDVAAIVERHVLPGYQALAQETADLEMRASEDCSPKSPALIDAYHDAFDAWINVSHLRFGPSEQDDRAFALAFWPDPRGSTPKVLAELIRNDDPSVSNPEDFAAVSVAGRGFYALEFLLYEPQFTDPDVSEYSCALLRAVAIDIARNAAAILQDWEGGYAQLMSGPGNDIYRTSTEAAQQFFTALSTGLEFTSDTRLARPLGTFDRPRPNRAEARRSERSLRHVMLSLSSTKALAGLISMENADVEAAFDSAIARATELDDPSFANVDNPQGRLRVEALQQNINVIRNILAQQIGPSLGIAAGFNALDGD
ncbi:MAG: imelysin family protein [Pseudomonadota bacterium]